MSITDGLDLVSSHACAHESVPRDPWTRLRAESPVRWCTPDGFEPFWASTDHVEVAVAHPLRILSATLGVPRASEPDVLRLTDELGGEPEQLHSAFGVGIEKPSMRHFIRPAV